MWAETAPLDPERQRHLLEEVVDVLDSQVTIISSDGTVVYLSHRWRTLQGNNRSLITAHLGESIREDGLASHDAVIPALRDALTAIWGGRYAHYSRRLHLDFLGKPTWVVLEVHRLAIGDVLILLRDVTALAAHQEELEHRATRDPLTQLPNRALIIEELDRAISKVHDGQGNLGVLICDIDGFKGVNDTFGHATGDELLIQVTQRWTQALRPGDVFGRLGGDEFVVIAPGLSDSRELHAIAERLCQAVSEPFRCRRGMVTVSACVGAVFIRSGADHTSVESVLERADRALYGAKHEGTQCIRITRMNGNSRGMIEASGASG